MATVDFEINLWSLQVKSIYVLNLCSHGKVLHLEQFDNGYWLYIYVKLLIHKIHLLENLFYIKLLSNLLNIIYVN